MKIDEFVKKVNEVAHVNKEEDHINIYSTGNEVSGDWFLSVDPHQKGLDIGYDWVCLGIGPVELQTVLDAVAELEATPVKERFPEKKYRLVANPNALEEFGDGSIKYVHQINRTWDSFKFVFGEPTIFSQSELTSLENVYPMMKPSIEAMKEEVKEDE